MDKEDGEISDEEQLFTCGNTYDGCDSLRGPELELYRSIGNEDGSSDDLSSNSDSDDSVAAKRFKSKEIEMKPLCDSLSGQLESTNSYHKPIRKNNVWSNVMQEQVLSEEIGDVGLKGSLLKGERSVESYVYMHPHSEGASSNFNSSSDNESLKNKRIARKRSLKSRLKRPSGDLMKARHLVCLTPDPNWTNEEFGNAIAEALHESKPELIVRCVEVLGKEKALDLYMRTRELEKQGGLLILNCSRRRTSGGIYLQLMKQLPDVGKEELQLIFPHEDAKEQQLWRKRKRAHRRRRNDTKFDGAEEERLDSAEPGQCSDSSGGIKCPGSTPVTSPVPSDNEDSQVELRFPKDELRDFKEDLSLKRTDTMDICD